MAAARRREQSSDMNWKRYRLLLGLMMTLIVTHASGNHVKCQCPNIRAMATGSSSCSASESNGQCIVSFNEFDLELELAARDLLQRYGQWSTVSFIEFAASDSATGAASFSRSAARTLYRRNPIRVMDQIMIYALVAQTQGDASRMDARKAAQVHAVLRGRARQLGRIFVEGGRRYDNNGVVVALGCFEFRRPELWGMYKSSWSNSLNNNQC